MHQSIVLGTIVYERQEGDTDTDHLVVALAPPAAVLHHFHPPPLPFLPPRHCFQQCHHHSW